MPLIRSDGWHLVLLIAVLPLQYFLVQYYDSSSISHDYAITKVLSHLNFMKVEYLEWKSWRNWFVELCSNFAFSTNQQDDYGESPAIEVIKYRDEDSAFGTSNEPRSPRPPFVKYRIGQVIKHKIYGYRGVIIAWDKEAQAPENWIKEMHGENKHWRYQPNYAILVDTRDRLVPQMTYVPEENLQIITHTKVVHSDLDDYFESYNGVEFVPRPWLKAVYPYD